MKKGDVKDRIGETNTMKCGMECKIIAYHSALDIDVKFTDGTIVYKKRYDHFKEGAIQNPNISNTRVCSSRVGEINTMNDGSVAKIIAYRRLNSIDVMFDNDENNISYDKTYTAFKNGRIMNPKKYVDYGFVLKDRTGETKMMNCGMNCTILKYHSYKKIDVEFEDGTKLFGKKYEKFKKGLIDNPELKKKQKELKQKQKNNERKEVKNRFKEQRLNEIKKMESGDIGKIIQYINAQNIKVEFNDGGIIEKTKYSRFAKGLLISPNNEIAKKERQKEINDKLKRSKYINQSLMMECGLVATIIEYNGFNDVTVEFENGQIIEHTSCKSFSKRILRPNNYSKAGASFGETAILFYLKDYGYKKYPKYSLKNKGFKAYELDVYNEELNIAIEYDGFWHDKEVERDKLKNKLFKDVFGGRIIRIRDKNIQKLSDGISEDYYITMTAWNHKDFEKVLKVVFKSIGLENIDVNLKRDKDAICKFYYKDSPINKMGESKVMECGLKTTIIKYNDASDIDVEFENGVIVKNTTYKKFEKGKVLCPGYTKLMHERTGETRKMNCGLNATILKYNSATNIEVIFENGTIVKNAVYRTFKEHRLNCPGYSQYKEKRLGATKKMNCGMNATVIRYNTNHDIDVQFENGEISRHKGWSPFCMGKIAPPSFCNKSKRN